MSTIYQVKVRQGAGHVEIAGFPYNPGDFVDLTADQFDALSANAKTSLVSERGVIVVDEGAGTFVLTQRVNLDELASGEAIDFRMPVAGALTSVSVLLLGDGPGGSGHSVTLNPKVGGSNPAGGAIDLTLTSADVAGMTNASAVDPTANTNAGYFLPEEELSLVVSGTVEGTDEVTRITLTATGGEFQVAFTEDTTDPIDWDAEEEDILPILEAVLGEGNVEVTRDGIEGDGDHIDISYVGDLAETNRTAPTTVVTALEGTDAGSVGIVVTTPGDDDPATDEVVTFTVIADDGTHRLSWGGNETADIPFDANAAAFKAAIVALPGIESADINVVGGPGDATGSTPYVATHGATLAATNIGAYTSTENDLTVQDPGDGTAVVSTLTGGVGDPSFTDGEVMALFVGLVLDEEDVADILD